MTQSTGKGKGTPVEVESVQKPAKGKTKAKKGKIKKAMQTLQPTPIREANASPMPAHHTCHTPPKLGESQEELGVGDGDDIHAIASGPSPAKSCPISPLDESSLTIKHFEITIPNTAEDGTQANTIKKEEESNTLRPVSLAATVLTGTTDLSTIQEGEEGSSTSLAKSSVTKEPDPSTLPQKKVEARARHDIAVVSSDEQQEQPMFEAVATVAKSIQTVSNTSDPVEPLPSLGIALDSKGPAVPVRQVRSSWLSKALGTGTVPIAGLHNTTSENFPLRTSFAAPSQRPNGHSDFAMTRKSLAPSGGTKRKSEEGRGEEDAEENRERPEKLAKADSGIFPITKPVLEMELPSTAFPGSTQILASSTTLITTDPSPVSQNPRSDIYRVTKALDDLRERAQAKEMAKQRAVPKATSTGAGFLRGLGNLGRSLGLGGAKTAEDEALRIEEERLAEIQAQEELERLIGEVTRPSQREEDVVGSTTPEAAVPVVANLGDKDKDEVLGKLPRMEELEDELDEPLPQASTVRSPRQPLDRPTTPPRLAPIAIISTTPIITPPRTVVVLTEAPAIRGRPEKHLYPSPAKPVEPAGKPLQMEPVGSVDSRMPSDVEKHEGVLSAYFEEAHRPERDEAQQDSLSGVEGRKPTAIEDNEDYVNFDEQDLVHGIEKDGTVSWI